VLWTAMFAVAWLARSKPLKFAWLFLMLGVAPVAFTAPRGPAQYYLVLFAWVLFAATLLVQVSAYVSKRSNRAVLLFCGTMLFLFGNYKAIGWSNVWTVRLEGPVIHGTAWQLHQLYPSLPHGTRILFLNDPFGVNYGDMLFITQLSYNDASIVVDRVKTMDHKPSATYDHVIDFKDGRFIEVPSASPTAAAIPENSDTSSSPAAHRRHSPAAATTREAFVLHRSGRPR
jgi:hypothetical protein